jgi:hypothetical protein
MHPELTDLEYELSLRAPCPVLEMRVYQLVTRSNYPQGRYVPRNVLLPQLRACETPWTCLVIAAAAKIFALFVTSWRVAWRPREVGAFQG